MTESYTERRIYMPSGGLLDVMVVKCDICKALIDRYDRLYHENWHEEEIMRDARDTS